MTTESTQPFNINEDTAEPSHRPEHDRGREAADDKLGQSAEEVSGSTGDDHDEDEEIAEDERPADA
jgi:hypothetical protein